MLPLPAEPFDPARLLAARVDSRARVCVRQNYYSVPARYAGRLSLRLSAMTVEALDGPQVVAQHERAAGKYADFPATVPGGLTPADPLGRPGARRLPPGRAVTRGPGPLFRCAA